MASTTPRATVGAANFAPPSNHKTAEGMQVQAAGDHRLQLQARGQVTYTQRELLDCVRLCVADETPSGIPLGTGAESFLYAACLRAFLDENRTLWRAIRMAELRLPLPPAEARLLARGASFVRVVRSFAETAVGVGSPYAATGAWYLGTTRTETVWVGRRSGESITRRSLAKLQGVGDGHVHQVLRATWEGSAGVAVARHADLGHDPGRVPARRGPTGRTRRPVSRRPPARADERLAQPRGSMVEPAGRTRSAGISRPTRAGYESRSTSPKHRYATFLANRPYYVLELARRCRYLRAAILQAEAAWYSEATRWPRGIGYGWPRPPQALRRPAYPRRPAALPDLEDSGDSRV